MASVAAARNYANLTRELRVLEHIAPFMPPDFEDLVNDAIREEPHELSGRISETKDKIAELRDRYSVTRWVDADPVYRDAHSHG